MVATQSNAPWTNAPYPTPEGMNPALGTHAPSGRRREMTELLPSATNDGEAFPDGEWTTSTPVAAPLTSWDGASWTGWGT